MKKVSFILVLLLIALSFGGKKNKNKKPSSGGSGLKDWLLGLRRPKTTARTTTVKPTAPQGASKGDFNWMAINSTDKFYEVFKVPRLPQHSAGARPEGGHGSSVDAYNPWFHCVARRTLVELPTAPYGHLYFPSCAVLTRCSGCAFQYKLYTCKPDKGAVRMRTVEYYNIALHGQSSGISMSVGSGIQMSYTIESVLMEEHLSCSFQCIKTPDSCNPITQNWNNDQCSCECKPEHMSHNVHCKGDFKYDDDTCTCICAKAKEECIPFGIKKWSQSECGCVCKENLSRCPRGMSRDPNSCKCV